jgi:2-amino-4-hydroxy-6-hydroxymethyldihydropteridine diphosphokinase
MLRQIFFGLGSNCGDRFANLVAARDALKAQVNILRCSSVYETPALLPENAPAEWDIPFLNAVISGETDLEPLALLEFVKKIESEIGRQHRGHWGPREIDIDILLMDGVAIQTELLTIPHLEMLKRDFVMMPLQELGHTPHEAQRADIAESQDSATPLSSVRNVVMLREDLCL